MTIRVSLEVAVRLLVYGVTALHGVRGLPVWLGRATIPVWVTACWR